MIPHRQCATGNKGNLYHTNEGGGLPSKLSVCARAYVCTHTGAGKGRRGGKNSHLLHQGFPVRLFNQEKLLHELL